MPTRTERYRFSPFTIEDVNAIPQPLPGGYADVARGGGMTFERVVFLGPDGTSRAELHLKKGHVKKLEQRLALPPASIRQSRHDRSWVVFTGAVRRLHPVSSTTSGTTPLTCTDRRNSTSTAISMACL